MTTKSGELTLELVRNANGTGLDLKESIRLAIIHLQKIPDGSAGTNKITSTILGFVQAVGEADAWKKAEDASAVGGAPYMALGDTKLQHLFGIIEGSPRLKKAVPQGARFYDEWTVCRCHIRKFHGVKESDSEEVNAAMRSVLNDVHRKLFDAIIQTIKPLDTLTHLRAGDSPLARMCTAYESDGLYVVPGQPGCIFNVVDNKLKLLPHKLPVVMIIRAALDTQGSTSAAMTTATFGALTNGIRAIESMTAHQTRMREATVKITAMKFADLEGFLNSVQAFSAFNKMCAMRDEATNAGDNLKVSVWREACLKVCIKMIEDPRPLTLERLDTIFRDAYAALDDGLGNQENPPLSTTSLATKLQEQADAHKKDINDLKHTINFKTRGICGDFGDRGGRGSWRGGLAVGHRGGFQRGGGRGHLGGRGEHRGGRGGHANEISRRRWRSRRISRWSWSSSRWT